MTLRRLMLVPVALMMAGGAATASDTFAASSAGAHEQPRDAASVLRDVRAALGGEAALDAIKSVTVGGTVTEKIAGFTLDQTLDLSILLPDHYLSVQKDFRASGPITTAVTYYTGFRGDTLIRRTESTIPFPPDPLGQDPVAAARRDREMTANNKREFARLALILFGTSFSGYELQFAYVGTEQHDGRAVEVVEATGLDGYRMRLAVDAATHLPVTVTNLATREATRVVTMTSTMATKGSQIVSQSPPRVSGSAEAAGGSIVERRLVVSNYKVQDGVNWPHRLTEMAGTEVVRQMDLKKFRLNPKLEPKRFEIR